MTTLREADIKRAVDDFLTYQQNLGKLVFLRLNSGDFIETRGETRRRIRGCPKGTADYLVLHEGGELFATDKLFACMCVFIELKSPAGKQSKEQKEFQALVEAQGAEYHIVRSVSELERIL